MRIAIATRIFSPEPSAASFRLETLATALSNHGHEVTVLTSKLPKNYQAEKCSKKYMVRRAPVLRDKTGYLRGYLQYMSFDIPLFFRLLFEKRFDAIVVEPPPTTGFVVRLVSILKRCHYFYYAADIWSDAASQATGSAVVVKTLRKTELAVMQKAELVFSVSKGVTNRLEELGVFKNVKTVGNGIQIGRYTDSNCGQNFTKNHFVYAGTASELHGANIFVQALKKLSDQGIEARVTFIGGGSQINEIRKEADKLNVINQIDFKSTAPIETVYNLLSCSTAALASLKPDTGYDYAFPTKLYTATLAGTPLLFTGKGPAIEFVNTLVNGQKIGVSSIYTADEVASHMKKMITTPTSSDRRKEVSRWAETNLNLEIPANKITELISEM